MKIIVTGACGFLGSHVCELFKNLGWEIVAIDNLTDFEFKRSGYKTNIARLYNSHYLMKEYNIPTTLIDIRYWNSLKHLDGDYIVHTAAQPTMTLSIKYPRYDLKVNLLGTYNMLELARKLDIPIVVCSTIHIYGNNINNKLIEKETRFDCEPKSIPEDYKILNGDISPLHASKRAAEIYTQCYIDTYGLKAAVFRLTGMYGPRQFAGIHHGWVSNFIIRTLKGLPIYIYGTDKQVRDILFVSDAVRAFKNYYERQIPGIYNIGGGLKTSISLRETLDMIEEITGIKQNRILLDKRFGDLYYFISDITKARNYLSWEPLVLPREGLTITINWIKNNLELFEGIT